MPIQNSIHDQIIHPSGKGSSTKRLVDSSSSHRTRIGSRRSGGSGGSRGSRGSGGSGVGFDSYPDRYQPRDMDMDRFTREDEDDDVDIDIEGYSSPNEISSQNLQRTLHTILTEEKKQRSYENYENYENYESRINQGVFQKNIDFYEPKNPIFLEFFSSEQNNYKDDV